MCATWPAIFHFYRTDPTKPDERNKLRNSLPNPSSLISLHPMLCSVLCSQIQSRFVSQNATPSFICILLHKSQSVSDSVIQPASRSVNNLVNQSIAQSSIQSISQSISSNRLQAYSKHMQQYLGICKDAITLHGHRCENLISY
jgi:hypothetical protein